jgi:hypothetical protein
VYKRHLGLSSSSLNINRTNSLLSAGTLLAGNMREHTHVHRFCENVLFVLLNLM